MSRNDESIEKCGVKCVDISSDDSNEDEQNESGSFITKKMSHGDKQHKKGGTVSCDDIQTIKCTLRPCLVFLLRSYTVSKHVLI